MVSRNLVLTAVCWTKTCAPAFMGKLE